MAEIKPIGDELSELMAGFAKASLGGNVEETPVTAAATNVPVEETPTEVPVEPAKSGETTVTLKEVPKVPETPDANFSDWDTPATTSTDTPAVVDATKTINMEVLGELGKVLGIEKVSGVEDVVKTIQGLKAEVERTKSIHPELKKAIELADKGGDFYEYLKVTAVDYSKTDPVELYENYVIDQLADTNGKVDEDKVNEYLDSIPDMDKQLRGRELQKRLVGEQSRRVAEIEAEATRNRERNDAQLRAALSGLSEIDGFKVDDSHRRETFEWITSGKMMKDLFYGSDGSLDPIKAAKIAFRNKYHEKIDTYLKNKIRNATKREILADTTNAQITSTSSLANPTVSKEFGLNEYIKSLEQQMNNR